MSTPTVRVVPEAELGPVLDALYPLVVAGAPLDQPHEPPPTLRCWRSQTLTPWFGDPVRLLLAEQDGHPVGWARVELPVHDNPHLAAVELQVAPGDRRRGTGRALWAGVLQAAREQRRRAVVVEAPEGSALAAFCAAAGATPRLVDVRRHQRLDRLDPSRVGALRAEAERAAAGYRLEAWVGPTPPELRGALAKATEALNDAPLGTLDYDDERWDAARVAARDAAVAGAGLRMHTVLALAADGTAAGLTDVAVAEDGAYAWQWGTAVAAGHRGHRLGMLLKATMVERLRALEPALEVVSTWNADSNAHMVAVNEALGYLPVGRGSEWQLDL